MIRHVSMSFRSGSHSACLASSTSTTISTVLLTVGHSIASVPVAISDPWTVLRADFMASFTQASLEVDFTADERWRARGLFK
jgi:hypothetical protein